MADNMAGPSGTGATIASDKINDVDYQRVKLTFGVDGAAADVSAGDPLPVTGSFTATVDSEFPAAAALADNTANPTTTLVGACTHVFDGTTWDRWTGAVTQSGTWNVGTVTTVTTVATVTSLSQLAGQAINLGAGTVGTGTLRVTLASDQTTITNTIGNVGTVPITTGGLSTYSFLSTAAAQAVEIKASAGQVYALQFFNTADAPVFVRLYNQTGAPGTGDAANIKWRGVVPANADSDGAGFVVQFPNGIACGTGIGLRCTAAVADNDNTSLSANVILGNVQYK